MQRSVSGCLRPSTASGSPESAFASRRGSRLRCKRLNNLLFEQRFPTRNSQSQLRLRIQRCSVTMLQPEGVTHNGPVRRYIKFPDRCLEGESTVGLLWPPPSLLPLALAAECLDADACRDADAEAGACIVCCACRGEGGRGFASSPNSASTSHPFLQLPYTPPGPRVRVHGHVAARRRARATRTFPNHDETFRQMQLAHGVR